MSKNNHNGLHLTCPSFTEGFPIPKDYTADGQNASPPLAWTDPPEGTRSFALICDDPDAPSSKPWVHWVLFKLPGTATALPEGIPAETREVKNPAGALQGLNSWAKLGWGGPLPPVGHGTHHYHFKLYALDAAVSLPPSAGKEELLRAMTGHVLAEGELIGTYRR